MINSYFYPMKAVPKINLSETLSLSRFVHGYWRLADWEMSDSELLFFIEELMALGITSFDHADIYGNYSCEKLFGNALRLKPSLRDKMQIITKCGIKLNSYQGNKNKIKVYDYSYDHILESVETSLTNFGTDRIDLLLFHRPAPFFDPAEVAKAMEQLQKQEKVLHFGVSNFNPLQFEVLQAYTPIKLLSNQVEVSPYCLEHFDNGNIDFFLKEKIHPMAWSPLAGGKLFKPVDEVGKRLLKELSDIAKELNAKSVEEVIYAWLLKHPAGIIPILGSGKLTRIKLAVQSLEYDMSLEQWYRIYNAAKGADLP